MKRLLPLFLLALLCLPALLWHSHRDEVAPQTPSERHAPRSTTASSGKSAAVAAVSPAVSPTEAGDDAQPDPAALIHSLRPETLWRGPVPEESFADFRTWSDRWTATKPEDRTPEFLAQGLALAERRRHEMADLIDQNPRRALQLAVPFAVRSQLPQPIAAQLETPVSATGDLWVAALVPKPGETLKIAPVQRTLVLNDGREFGAFTYGRRAESATKMGLAVHGVALDGKIALSDLPGRVLDPAEAALAKQKENDPTCPTSGLASDSLGDEVVVDWNGTEKTFFCGPAHAGTDLLAAADAESAQLPPIATNGGDSPSGGDAPIAQSGYTEGNKKLLIIRVDFPDKIGQVVSDATLTSLINNMKSHWATMSYGKLNYAAYGAGSTFTPTLRLPNGHASYTSFGTMLSAARSAAADAGFRYQDYSFEVVVTGDKPDVGFGGIAFVGARGAWLANGQWNLGVCSHEVGHNFSLNHAGFWDTTDGTTIGEGANVEYGNPFDHMGGASSSNDAHFGARQKNQLDWIVDGDVAKIGANGQFLNRIAAFDHASPPAGKKAIAVDKANTTNDYWIEYRGEYADSNSRMRDGVVLNWGPYAISNAKPMLLDVNPATSDKNDSPLLMGRTFSDTVGGIHITPVAKGTDTVSGARWMDVQVNRGTFTGNLPPAATISATNVNPATNASVTFTANASDPDGDTLAYFWEWGDDTYSTANTASASKSWSSTGTKTVRCRISDMKGQVTTAQLLVQVGTSSTFFIQGVVNGSTGPVEGAVVSAGGKTDATDSSGYYAITGVAAGSHTVTATKSGLTINPLGFTNPVTVGPSKQNINFTAPAGSPRFSTLYAALVDQGSSTGDLMLPVTDPDTPFASLTLSAISSNPAAIAASGISFGTKTTYRTVNATAVAGASGTTTITITATDPQGNTTSAAWTVTVNATPVLTPLAQTTTENSPLDLDLGAFATDDLTAAGQLRHEISRVRNGTVSLLADGRTARFTPSTDFNGAASFSLTTRDRSLSSRTVFLYQFEDPDTTADGKITDGTNHRRDAAFETHGVEAEYAYVAGAPAVLAPQNTKCLSLSSSATGGVRLRKTLGVDDLNYNDADWTFTAWVRRSTNTTNDIIFHLGEGDGFGTNSELHLHFAAGADTLVLGKYGAAGVEKEISAPALPPGQWQHVAVVYDRTATNTGTFSLYVNGLLAGSATGVVMDVLQTQPFYLGGAQNADVAYDRWFDGLMDDVLLQTGLSSATEINGLAKMGAGHQLGLVSTATVAVTVNGVNQPPTLVPPASVGLLPGGTTGLLPYRVADAETEHRSLTVTATSSNTALVPTSALTLTAAPATMSGSAVGTVSAAGSQIEDHGTFLVAGSGAGIGGTADEFHWVRQNVTGDGEFTARVLSMDFPNANAKAGVMLRDASTTGAAFAYAYVTPGAGVAFMVRSALSASTETVATVPGVTAPCFLRVVRSGDSFTGFYAADLAGVPGPWLPLGTAKTLTFPTVGNRFGLAVTSAVDGTLCNTVFDSLGGTVPFGGARSLTVSPATGVTGSSTITLRVSDGTATTTASFNVSVMPETPPVVAEIPPVSITEGSGPKSFTVNLSDLHTAPGALTLSGVSSNQLVLPDSRITITGEGSARTVTVNPLPSETGTITVTLTVGDGALTSTRDVTLNLVSADPSVLVRSGARWKFATTASTTWKTAEFDDSAWTSGPSPLGYGDGDEATTVSNTPSRITTYFRRSFNITSPLVWNKLRLGLRRDDGAVVYLNGVELLRTNLPAGTIASTTPASAAIGNSLEQEFLETITASALKPGLNILAVEVHQNATTSSDLAFDFELRAETAAPVRPVSTGSFWSYLDDGTEPAANWKDPGFSPPATWKFGQAQLGYGDGDEATVIASGPVDNFFITSYFRRTFLLPDTANLAGAAVRLKRDDGAIVYVNGTEVFRSNMPVGVVTSVTPAASSVGGVLENTWFYATFDSALLKAGDNVIAVEVHQFEPTSSDISFDLELLTYPKDTLPSPKPSFTPTSVIVEWPTRGTSWKLQGSDDLVTWTTITTTPEATPDGQRVTLPTSGAKKFYRLMAE